MHAHQRSCYGYRSVVENWDSKSAVRAKPRRTLAEKEEGLTFFSLKITPAAAHPLVTSRGQGDVNELLVRRLYSYLDFTTILEQEIVNPVVLRLSRDSYGLDLPAKMKFDAYRIYCDEAYHALFSADMKQQVAQCTQIAPTPCVEPFFARAIGRAQEKLPPELRGLAELCAAVVSETLISGTLTDIPKDKTVVSAVRESLADHAADERAHHAYFTRVLETVWPQLDKSKRELLSPHFGDFILAFLAPDATAHRECLSAMRFRREECVQIIWESYPHAVTLADARHAARSTLDLLRRTGVLDFSEARDHFSELGLLAQ